MSATRTFTPLTANTDLTTITAYTNGTKWGYQDAEWARQAIDVLAYNGGHYDLGGSDDVGIMSASYVPVVGTRELSLNGDTLGGLTLEVVVWTRTSNASGSVTVRVRNTTDSSTAATSTAVTSTTLTKEAVTVTLASGVKVYRLEIIGGSATIPVYGFGHFRFRKVAA